MIVSVCSVVAGWRL
jgi:hypothetical protein